MDPNKVLEEERARRVKLEEELASWRNTAIEKLTPEQLATLVQTQQVESLTYHLLKCRQSVDEFTVKLRAKDRELADAVENIKYLEKELDSRTKSLEKMIAEERGRKESELRRVQEEESLRQKFGGGAIPTDAELDMLIGPIQPTLPKPKAEPQKTIREFLHLMRRIQRVKLIDASLLLDVNPEVVTKWAENLTAKGYLTVQGYRDDRTIFATDKLLKER